MKSRSRRCRRNAAHNQQDVGIQRRRSICPRDVARVPATLCGKAMVAENVMMTKYARQR